MRLREFDSAGVAELLAAPEPVLLHFGTDWCAPCKRLERVLQTVLSENDVNVRIGKVNVEDHPEVARAYSVSKNPTLCLFRDGAVVDKHEGFLDGDGLLAFLDRHTL